MSAILGRYPKQRPPLPAAFQEIYQQHYRANRRAEYRTTSLSRRLESWMHRRVADDVSSVGRRATLEIGAGTLNHLVWEDDNPSYDVVEPFRALYEDSPLLGRVRRVFGQMSDVPASERYDRIVSIATFEHLDALPDIVARSALVLADGGSLRVAIPNEGTILWRLGTMLTGAEFRLRYGLDYQILMRHEHVNTADEIEEVLRWFFGDVRVAVLGLSRRFAFYRFIECRKPDLQRALQTVRATPEGAGRQARSAA